MRRRLWDDRGQTAAFTVLWLFALVGMAALVLDVGAWFRADRRLQSVADAAALAGAQALPSDPGTAAALAEDYAMRNGGPSPSVSFSDTNETIRVSVEETAPGVFSRLFDVASVGVGAKASASSSSISAIHYAAPIVVRQEKVACIPGCLGTTLQLRLNDDSSLSGGDFGLADVGRTGNPSVPTLVSWVTDGLDADMPAPEWYDAIGSAKFNSQNFEDAVKSMAGTPLLFPVYDQVNASSNPAQYHVVGWAAFVIASSSDVKLNGCGNSNERCYVRGHFVRYVAQGLTGGSGTPDWGVKSISLSE